MLFRSECGHTICEHCIKQLSRCCMCNTSFRQGRRYGRDRLAGLAPRDRDYFMDIIDPPVITEFKDNYALIHLMDKKVKKDFDVCKVSRQFEEFFCKECKEVLCSDCIDSCHSTHSLRKMSLPMFKASKNIRKKLDDSSSKSAEIDSFLKKLQNIKISNEELGLNAPKQIEQIFEKILVLLHDAKDQINTKIQREVTAKKKLISEAEESISSLSKALGETTDQMFQITHKIYLENFIEHTETLERAGKISLEVEKLTVEASIRLNMTKINDLDAKHSHNIFRKVLSNLKKLLPKSATPLTSNPFDTNHVILPLFDSEESIESAVIRSHRNRSPRSNLRSQRIDSRAAALSNSLASSSDSSSDSIPDLVPLNGSVIQNLYLSGELEDLGMLRR